LFGGSVEPLHDFNVEEFFQTTDIMAMTCSNAPPLKVFILAGQSNMCGMGSIKHLNQLVSQPGPNNEYRETLWSEETNSFQVRDNVFVINEKSHGKLTIAPNSGLASKGNFGPEVMFGWTVGDALDNREKPIVLIKTAWGGKSLRVDFRPPSSGILPNDTKHEPGHFGWLYRKMMQDIKDALDNLSQTIPGYTIERGYELSGFVWFHGWNDMLEWPSVNEYGTNLANLIRDVRRDLNSPHLPVVIGELGQHGITLEPGRRWTPRVLTFRKHQQDVTLMEEFRNNTLFVPTACYSILGKETFNGEYHYNGRADTFFHIGQAMGRGMLQLMSLVKEHDENCAEETQ